LKLKTFTAETYKEALEKVKAELGEDAMIVSSKEIKKSRLGSPGLYEIVALIEEDDNKKEDVKLDISSVVSKVKENIESSKNSLSTPKINKNKQPSVVTKDKDCDVEVKELKEQINKLADTIKLMQATMWEMREKNELEIPPEFSEIYALAKASGMHYKHLDEIMKQTIKHMPLKMRKNREAIKRYFYTLLKKMIPIRIEREIVPPYKKIMMFVGPTGVGKTTTIAKLAARYAYMLKRRYKVGIITLDSYRIGAIEQIRTYAKMMKLPIETVVDPDEFEEALNVLRHNDYILIDTVGSSQHDKEKIEKINSFLSVESYAEINVNLVLSAVTKYEDLLDIVNNFSILPIDTFVFTKLDETKTYGNIFSLLLEAKKPVSYFSIGQEVPKDIMVADADYILKGILSKELS